MKNWTEPAEKRLEEFLSTRPKEWGLEGDGADELAADLRSHVHEELQRDGVEMVTLEALERVLGRIGGQPEPTPQPKIKYPPPLPLTHEQQLGCRSLLKNGFVFWTCCAGPVFALLFEAIWAPCADAFFSPLPTWWHLILVTLTVGIITISFFSSTRGEPVRASRLIGPVGFAIVVALYYALLFVPVIPFSLLALCFGVGIIPLSPIATTIWLIWFQRKLRKEAKSQEIVPAAMFRRRL